MVERNGIEVTEDFERSNTPGPSLVADGRVTPPTSAIPRVVEVEDTCLESCPCSFTL